MSSESFLSKVTAFIRSKEARVHVHEELKQHIEHSKNAWMEKGYPEEEAGRKAIEEMGSPAELGKSMDKIHRPKWDWVLIGSMILLVAASFVPILTMHHVQFGKDMTDYFVENKIIHIIAAVILIAILMYFDYRKLRHYSLHIYGIALLLLFVVLYMPNAPMQGEAMFKLGPVRIQAWTVLPFLLVAFAGLFSERKLKGWQLIALFILPLYCFVSLPNLAVACIYILVITVLFSFSYFPGKTKRNVFIVIAGLTVVFAASSIYMFNYSLQPYQKTRMNAYLNPEQYSDTGGFIILLIKQALEGAGWFGAETVYSLPEAHTDYALVQLIQAYGYTAGIAVLVVILVIAIRILWISRTMPGSFGKLLVLSAVTLYSVQSAYSILMVFGLLPLTGIPLPFISYGLTPLLLNAFFVGLVLSVYRRKSFVANEIEQKYS
ncbi:FtsW/RodA/SpoVE family cell cycle protein [Solibacillus silvestris]|uniref:FtsW/RodA/SpoVE family cell cycle protein n=1 Tax=Solibacillus silvestris TaxID=76853 RepID=UPI003F7D44E7